ncbi:MAG: RluA family pseudouridine synthase [Coleofasciculaceae cyanobacterium SM2_1_6]|nr:RluA family pseudouridine synthase [Coleofasciculaceae cyanobacterium SM2_1_6]
MNPIELPVPRDHHTPQRLDVYLAQGLRELTEAADLSRSRLQKLIEAGQVMLNEQVCREKKTMVQAGDRLSVSIPPDIPLNLQPEAIPLDILYEDQHLIILNKPAGLVVHPAPGHSHGTLVNALLAHCPLATIGGVLRPGIVHRLDKDTTGAIAVAKTDQAHHHLQQQLKEKTAYREYLGIVYGCPKTESGIVDQPLGRHPVDRQKMAVIPLEQGGRTAVTHWQIQERLGNYTLLKFQLETGRTHQIRVHSAFMKHPIVGDPVYSHGKDVGVNLPGQALHAWKLRLIHPVSGELIEAIAPLPETFVTLRQILQKRQRYN